MAAIHYMWFHMKLWIVIKTLTKFSCLLIFFPVIYPALYMATLHFIAQLVSRTVLITRLFKFFSIHYVPRVSLDPGNINSWLLKMRIMLLPICEAILTVPSDLDMSYIKMYFRSVIYLHNMYRYAYRSVCELYITYEFRPVLYFVSK